MSFYKLSRLVLDETHRSGVEIQCIYSVALVQWCGKPPYENSFVNFVNVFRTASNQNGKGQRTTFRELFSSLKFSIWQNKFPYNKPKLFSADFITQTYAASINESTDFARWVTLNSLSLDSANRSCFRERNLIEEGI